MINFTPSSAPSDLASKNAMDNGRVKKCSRWGRFYGRRVNFRGLIPKLIKVRIIAESFDGYR